MKRFVRKICAVIFSIIAAFMLFNAAYYKTTEKTQLTAFEVYDAIHRSSQSTQYTALVLGDSVARQIFHPDYQEEDREVCYLATNQAILPAGNYILLENFLENNPQVKKVYYVARPDSLQGGINFIYTYSYFVTPLYREAFMKYLTPETRDGIEKVFGSFFARHEFPKWMLGKYPKLLELYNEGSEKLWKARNNIQACDMPDMTISYVAGMQRLCRESEVEFVLLSSPLPEGYDLSAVDELKGKMRAAGMEDLMEGYADSIYYIDREEFVDGIHMTKEYLEGNRKKILNILRIP